MVSGKQVCGAGAPVSQKSDQYRSCRAVCGGIFMKDSAAALVSSNWIDSPTLTAPLAARFPRSETKTPCRIQSPGAGFCS